MTDSHFKDLPPARRALGTVILPGSKSISNRVLLLSALASGSTRIEGLLQSDDTSVMLAALRQLGVRIDDFSSDSVSVQGVPCFPVTEAKLFLGNAGTAFRPLTAALALMAGHYTLSGVPRMHERPIGDLVDALLEMGARINYLGQDRYPPLEISPCGPVSDRVRVRGTVSSQFLTAVLMAAPLAVARSGRALTIEVVGELISRPYIEITLNLMARFGVQVQRQGAQQFVVLPGSQYQSPGSIFVEGDASSASYFLAMGAIGGGPVRVVGVGADSIQGDVAFADTRRQAREGNVYEPAMFGAVGLGPYFFGVLEGLGDLGLYPVCQLASGGTLVGGDFSNPGEHIEDEAFAAEILYAELFERGGISDGLEVIEGVFTDFGELVEHPDLFLPQKSQSTQR